VRENTVHEDIVHTESPAMPIASDALSPAPCTAHAAHRSESTSLGGTVEKHCYTVRCVERYASKAGSGSRGAARQPPGEPAPSSPEPQHCRGWSTTHRRAYATH